MKKPYLIILISAYLCILSACKKDAPDFVKPGEFPLGTSLGGGTAGGGTGSGSTTTGSYQPVKSGSYWKYEIVYQGATNEALYTMTGKSTQINGKTYYEVKLESAVFGTQTGYYYSSSPVYAQRANTFVNGITIELQYLREDQAVGSTWTEKITDNGLVKGVPGRIEGKVLEKNMSYSVNGKTFNNVIHTSLDLQYDLFGKGDFETVITYEFYTAKDVGVVENKSLVGGVVASTAKLTDYSIK